MLWMSVPAGIDRRGIAFPGRMSTFSSPASTTSPDFIPSVANTYAGLFPSPLKSTNAMRVVLFGSYSIRRTTPVTPRISRWKSTIRYLRLWPPPRCHTVMRPRLLRPPLFARPFVSALNGLPFHRWSRAVVMRPRWPGLVGLYTCGAREQKRRRRRIGG